LEIENPKKGMNFVIRCFKTDTGKAKREISQPGKRFFTLEPFFLVTGSLTGSSTEYNSGNFREFYKNLILVKNRNFGEKAKFCSKIEFFSEKSKF